jgi:intein/homing endonuclease
VTTEDGREILTAAEHRFLTEAGWRRLEQIRPGNEILVPSRIVARHMSATAELAKASSRNEPELILESEMISAEALLMIGST